MSDKDTNSQGKTPNDNLPFFRRFMKNYVLPERKLYLGSSDNNTDDLRQVSRLNFGTLLLNSIELNMIYFETIL